MAIRFGGYFDPFPLRKRGEYLQEVERILGRPVDTVMWYQWWDAGWLVGKRAKEFQPDWLVQAGSRDVLIKWEPWKPGRQIVQPRFALSTIVDGKHDAYLRRWANRIRECGRTIHLCPMPEMNGFWNQWSVPIGKHTREIFIATWRHIHQVFATESVTNVRWVWAPNAGDMPADHPMELFYPGSEFVDVLGLSVYNWGTVRHWSRWRSFADVIQPYYDRIAKLGEHPIWITEMGCAPVGGDKVAWIRDMFAYLPSLSRIDTVIWFDMNKETDWRITASSEISKEFRLS